jgi:hypothetical protein
MSDLWGKESSGLWLQDEAVGDGTQVCVVQIPFSSPLVPIGKKKSDLKFDGAD